MVADGLTDTVVGLELTLKVVPSDSCPLQGPVPVKDKLSVADCPSQIVGLPLIEPVGLGLTVTVADPDPVSLHPFESVTFVNANVDVEDGLTFNA